MAVSRKPRASTSVCFSEYQNYVLSSSCVVQEVVTPHNVYQEWKIFYHLVYSGILDYLESTLTSVRHSLWAIVLQIETLTTGLTSHFSHSLSLFWPCVTSPLLGLFFTFTCPFLVKGSHPAYTDSCQVLLQLQHQVHSRKYSFCRSYSPKSERKSWNRAKYFIRKAVSLPSSYIVWSVPSPWYKDVSLCLLYHATRDLWCVSGTTWLVLMLKKFLDGCLI